MPEPRTVTVRVDGTPAPEGSHRSFWDPRSQKVVTVHDNEDTLNAWRDTIAARARLPLRRAGGPFPDAVSVTVVFTVRRPPSAPRTRPFPSVRPDLDKLARAVLDALTSADAWGDDGQVVHLDCYEVYGAPVGATIRLTDSIPDVPAGIG